MLTYSIQAGNNANNILTCACVKNGLRRCWRQWMVCSFGAGYLGWSSGHVQAVLRLAFQDVNHSSSAARQSNGTTKATNPELWPWNPCGNASGSWSSGLINQTFAQLELRSGVTTPNVVPPHSGQNSQIRFGERLGEHVQSALPLSSALPSFDI